MKTFITNIREFIYTTYKIYRPEQLFRLRLFKKIFLSIQTRKAFQPHAIFLNKEQFYHVNSNLYSRLKCIQSNP